MSAPVGGASRTVTVKHGQTAELVTSYAPGPDSTDALTIINLGTERVWLSNDSMAAAGEGVPLEGGTPMAWTAAGALYATPDDANVTDVKLVLTSATTDYQPSPYALALATAAQLLATGVPTVLLETDLALNKALAHNVTDSWDVSDAASAVLQANVTGDFTEMLVSQYMGNGALVDEEYLTAEQGGTALARLAIAGATLKIKNVGAAGTYSLTTSNRPALRRWDSRRRNGAVNLFTVPSGFYANTSILELTPADATVKSQGLCYASLSTLCPTWRLTMQDVVTGRETTVADSGEAFTSSGGSKRVSRLIGVPPGEVVFTLYVLADFTGTATVTLTPAEV